MTKIYLYRRICNQEWATCDESRFTELSSHKLFTTKICYEEPVAPEAQRQSEPVAYRHTMHFERGCGYRFELTDSPESPFGKPDVDYDKSFSVTCEPLYAAPLSPDHSGGAGKVVLPDVDILAQIIRTVDGNHSLGTGALAERIIDKVKELNQ